MAKKKKKAKKTKKKGLSHRGVEKQLAIKSIASNLETAVHVAAECNFCGETYEDDDDSGRTEIDARASAAEFLHREGWREVSSEKFALIGLACSTCAKQPDKKRGE